VQVRHFDTQFVDLYTLCKDHLCE